MTDFSFLGWTIPLSGFKVSLQTLKQPRNIKAGNSSKKRKNKDGEMEKKQATESKKEEWCQRREVFQGLWEEMSIVTECCVVLRPEGKTQNLICRKKAPSLFISLTSSPLHLPSSSLSHTTSIRVCPTTIAAPFPHQQEMKSILKSFGKPQGLQTRK